MFGFELCFNYNRVDVCLKSCKVAESGRYIVFDLCATEIDGGNLI